MDNEDESCYDITLKIELVIGACHTLDMDKHFYSYCAGLFDARGGVRMAKSSFRLVLMDSRTAAIEEIYRIFGGRLMLGVERQTGHTNLILRLEDDLARPFIAAIWPFIKESREIIEAIQSNRFKDIQCINDRVVDIAGIPKEEVTKTICTVPGCSDPAAARGMCKYHYESVRKKMRSQGDTQNLQGAIKAFSYSVEPSESDKAYIAGYFDGCMNLAISNGSGMLYCDRRRLESALFIKSFYGGSIKPLSLKVYPEQRATYRIYRSEAIRTFFADVWSFSKISKEKLSILSERWTPTTPQGWHELKGLLAKETVIVPDFLNRYETYAKSIRTESDKAFAAGFIDAEGCLSLEKGQTNRRGRAACIAIHQTRPEAILWFYANYGGSLTYAIPKNDKWRPQLCLKIASERGVQRILLDIIPFLKSKTGQAKILEEFLRDESFDVEEGVKKLAQFKDDAISLKTFQWHSAANRQQSNFPEPGTALCRIAGCLRKNSNRDLCYKHYAEVRSSSEWQSLRHKVIPFKYASTPTEENKAYIGGFFDGDGNVFVEENSNLIRITFGQTTQDEINFIDSFYPGSIKPDKKKPKHNQVARYTLSGREFVLQFLRDVQPYVKEKKEIVDMILERWIPFMPVTDKVKLKQDIEEHNRYIINEDVLLDIDL